MSNQACSVFSLVCYANESCILPRFSMVIYPLLSSPSRSTVNSHKHVAHGPLSSPDAIVKVLKALPFFYPRIMVMMSLVVMVSFS